MARPLPHNLVEIIRSYANDPMAVVGTCAISAAMMATSQNKSDAGFLSLVALVPICLVLPTQRFWRSFGILALTYFMGTLLAITWMGRMGSAFGWATAMLAACAYGALFMAIPALACRFSHRVIPDQHGLLLLPPAWMLAEILQRIIPPRVSWTQLGMPLGDYEAMAQAASLLGPEFLSFLAAGAAVFVAVICRRTGTTGRLAGVVMGPGLMVLVMLWGQLHINALQGSPRPPLAVGVVQADMAKEFKADSNNWPVMLETYNELIQTTLSGRPYMIVLPEAAMPGAIHDHDLLKTWVTQTVVRAQRPLIFGTVDRVSSDSQQTHNAAVIMPPYGHPLRYKKLRLVPLAEYMPKLGPLSDWLKQGRDDLPQHVAGKTGVIFQIHNELLFGLMLGHEDIFPDLARQYARDSADLLIILLDSKRFNGTPLHVQHTRRAKLSAVAVGLPMLRCNNSLASQVITNTGRVIEDLRFGSSPDSQPRAAVMKVPLTAHATLYRWIGDTGVIAVLVLGMLGGLFGAGPLWRRIVRL